MNFHQLLQVHSRPGADADHHIIERILLEVQLIHHDVLQTNNAILSLCHLDTSFYLGFCSLSLSNALSRDSASRIHQSTSTTIEQDAES